MLFKYKIYICILAVAFANVYQYSSVCEKHEHECQQEIESCCNTTHCCSQPIEHDDDCQCSCAQNSHKNHFVVIEKTASLLFITLNHISHFVSHDKNVEKIKFSLIFPPMEIRKQTCIFLC